MMNFYVYLEFSLSLFIIILFLFRSEFNYLLVGLIELLLNIFGIYVAFFF